AGPRSVAVGGFNGDGTLDLAVADWGSNTVSVLLGNGDGTFQAPLTFTTGARPSSVAAGDFNGDGSLDLAVANEDNFSVSVLLGNGDQALVLSPLPWETSIAMARWIWRSRPRRGSPSSRQCLSAAGQRGWDLRG